MKKITQTRLHNPDNGIIGNCFAACIASILELDSAKDVLQIQEYYDDPRWTVKLQK